MHNTEMSNELFQRLSEFIHDEIGIKMTPAKKTMLETRLARRLRAVNLPSYHEYCDYLFSEQGMSDELTAMIDVVTTNKTDFFREPRHFEFLARRALPDLVKRLGAGVSRPLTAWSAACSSGEEAYTLAMVLEECALDLRGFHYQVLGTDISTRVLDKAKIGIYEEERAAAIPERLARRYLMRSREKDKRLVRVVPELRTRVQFRRLNFLEGDFGLREKMDVIFCRNVLIYFDRPMQEQVIKRLCDHLAPGGYLFTGHAETISGINAPLESVANTIYLRR